MTRPKQPDEFEEFDKVMDGLLSVPYSELQKKLEEEKRRKEMEKESQASLPTPTSRKQRQEK